jgi:hypothetical protein
MFQLPKNIPQAELAGCANKVAMNFSGLLICLQNLLDDTFGITPAFICSNN